MLGAPLPYVLVAAVGVVLLVVGAGLLHASGARIGIGRRLAGARGLTVAELLDLDAPPSRPVRIAGRVRCASPLHTPDDDRLVAYHRDVEVQLPGGAWRSIERLRETRSFELWDHGGSLPVDPALAAEPLVTIPHRWEGEPSELDAAFRPALDRLADEGRPAQRARSATRMISVTDRLLVLARVERGPGGLALVPPPGGYVFSTLALDDAMRLLGGGRRGRLIAAVIAVASGLLLGALGMGLALVASVAGG